MQAPPHTQKQRTVCATAWSIRPSRGGVRLFLEDIGGRGTKGIHSLWTRYEQQQRVGGGVRCPVDLTFLRSQIERKKHSGRMPIAIATFTVSVFKIPPSSPAPKSAVLGGVTGSAPTRA